MSPGPRLVAATAFAAASFAAALVSGCGVGPGPSSPGEATLTVTRDYGAQRLNEASEPNPRESETVIRFLDRETQLETRYGGGFVQSIDGLTGTYAGRRSSDWFFYVNGIESPVGAAEVDVRGGDRIWWDYRDWTNAMRIPAVVGSWPEPFLQASTAEQDRAPVVVECKASETSCATVRERLSGAGVDVAGASAGGDGDSPRVVVGSWARIGRSSRVAALAKGPATSGVFARFAADGSELVPLGADGSQGAPLGVGSGLVAALHEGEGPPQWLVTGTDEKGVAAAAGLLDADDLRDHFALAAGANGAIPLPLAAKGPS